MIYFHTSLLVRMYHVEMVELDMYRATSQCFCWAGYFSEAMTRYRLRNSSLQSSVILATEDLLGSLRSGDGGGLNLIVSLNVLKYHY